MTRNERLFLSIFNELNIEKSNIWLKDDSILSIGEVNNNIIESFTRNDESKILINGININKLTIPSILELLNYGIK